MNHVYLHETLEESLVIGMAAHTVCVKTEHLENRRVTISFIWEQMVCQDAFFTYTVLAMFIWNQYTLIPSDMN